jgi:hypothetical protein
MTSARFKADLMLHRVKRKLRTVAGASVKNCLTLRSEKVVAAVTTTTGEEI